METQSKSSAKDFFINLGAIVALYTMLFSLVNLLFTVINTRFPQISNYSIGTETISWPVATLIIFYPIFILLMWLLEREYKSNPSKQNAGIHKWLTYITLFLAGIALAGDLITVLYYFLDGKELTTGFLLKILVLLLIAGSVFAYYISDALGKLTGKQRIFWRIFSGLVVLVSIIWGFSVLGSPATQRLYKHDVQKVNDLQNISSQVQNFYQAKGSLPSTLSEVASLNYSVIPLDQQTGKEYGYKLIGQSAKAYQVCAEFNKASQNSDPKNSVRPIGYTSWTHPAGEYCFDQTIDVSMYKPVPIR